MPGRLVAFTRSVSREPSLPSIDEKADPVVTPVNATFAFQMKPASIAVEEEESIKTVQALLIDACLTFCGFLIHAALQTQLQNTKAAMCLEYSLPEDAICDYHNANTTFVQAPMGVLFFTALKLVVAYTACFRFPWMKMSAFSFIVLSCVSHMLVLEYVFVQPFLASALPLNIDATFYAFSEAIQAPLTALICLVTLATVSAFLSTHIKRQYSGGRITLI